MQSPLSPLPKTGPRPKVLVVDDSATRRTLLVRELERRGFEVLECRSGPEALDLLAKLEDAALPGFLLTDVYMPKMTGIELRQTLLEDPRLKSIQVTSFSCADRPDETDHVLKTALRRVESQARATQKDSKAKGAWSTDPPRAPCL